MPAPFEPRGPQLRGPIAIQPARLVEHVARLEQLRAQHAWRRACPPATAPTTSRGRHPRERDVDSPRATTGRPVASSSHARPPAPSPHAVEEDAVDAGAVTHRELRRVVALLPRAAFQAWVSMNTRTPRSWNARTTAGKPGTCS